MPIAAPMGRVIRSAVGPHRRQEDLLIGFFWARCGRHMRPVQSFISIFSQTPNCSQLSNENVDRRPFHFTAPS